MEELTTTSSREALAGGLIGLLKPAVEELDERVLAVRYVRPPAVVTNCRTFWYVSTSVLGHFGPESKLDIQYGP